MEIAVLALGCFWGPEIKFSKLEGIIRTEVGYCGGNTKNTTYEEVCNGNTNHAEVVKINFNNKIISYEKILDIFFEIHDPTTLNSQGPDFGTQYRSEIFYFNDEQKNIAEKVLKKNSTCDLMIVPELYLSGYGNEKVIKNLKETKSGQSSKLIANLCKKYSTAILYGYPEQYQNKLFNAAQCCFSVLKNKSVDEASAPNRLFNTII